MSPPSPEDLARDQDVSVVGGTYRETCVEPKVDALRGSGLRASALLGSLGRSVTFHTCVDALSEAEASALFHAFRVEPHVRPRSTPMTFAYDTPVSPARWGYREPPVSLEVAGSRVVAFGMVDAIWSIAGERVVLDPQHGDLDAMMAAVQAGSIALVLNAHEARRLTGLPPEEAGPALLGRGAQVVVIKQGALGGLVCSGDNVLTYGPIPTTSTCTIGSGDAFTAGFADAWFEDPADLLGAAQAGARVAAAHSMTDVPQVTPEQLSSLPQPLSHPGDLIPCIYLAAPFFSTHERLLVETARNALLDAGLRVFSPLHEVGAGGDEVAALDLDGVKGCDAVLALLDGADPGTVFEVGWATRAEIPVVGFTQDPALHDWTMMRGTGAPLSNDLTSAIHMAAWAAIRQVTKGSA